MLVWNLLRRHFLEPITLLTYLRRIHGFQGLDNSEELLFRLINLSPKDHLLTARSEPVHHCKSWTGNGPWSNVRCVKKHRKQCMIFIIISYISVIVTNEIVSPRNWPRGLMIYCHCNKWNCLPQELTTWTNDLLKARGHKLSQDLRKSISDGVTLPLILDVACK